MAGTMRERQPGVWELRVRAGRDPLRGKHRQISRTFRGSGRQASKALARLVTEAQDGSHAGSDKTVGELLDRWIDHLEARGRTPKTIDGYRSLARARLEPALGTVKLRRLTPVQLDDLYQSLLGAGLSPVYVRHCHAALSTALRQAVKWDWIGRSPAERATPPGAMPPEVSPPDAEGISRLISAVEKVDPDMASMLFVAATTGCRRGELCGLRWSDLEVDKATVTVRRSISDTSRGVEVKDPKTHRARRISLDAATVSVLTTHHERVEQRARDIGSELSSGAYIWSQEGDSRTPWKPDRVTDAFRTHRKRADLEHVNFHHLRNFSATTLAGAGVDVRTIAERLGHENPAITLRTYAHFLEATDRQAAEVMGKLALPDLSNTESQSLLPGGGDLAGEEALDGPARNPDAGTDSMHGDRKLSVLDRPVES